MIHSRHVNKNLIFFFLQTTKNYFKYLIGKNVTESVQKILTLCSYLILGGGNGDSQRFPKGPSGVNQEAVLLILPQDELLI